jgi:hypothetical protein
MLALLLRTVRHAHRAPRTERFVTAARSAARALWPAGSSRYAPLVTAGEEGVRGRTLPPPAYWPPGSPRGSWCRWRTDARPSRWSARSEARTNDLDGHHARPPAARRTGDGSAFGACCCAGKLRSPTPGTVAPTSPGPTLGDRRYVNPHAIPYARTYGNPYARRPRTPCWPERGITAGRSPKGGQSPAKTAGDWPPLGEVERPRRAVRFARLIQTARPRL